MSADLADNVLLLLDRSCELHGRWKRDEFSQNMYCDLVEGNIKSPIEQMFWVAFHVMALRTFCEVNQGPLDVDLWPAGIEIHPQIQLGKYRADFLVSYRPYEGAKPEQVVVELDGHDFHDRDKRQRSYEKRRDRDLQQMGLKVAHFTGSDVHADAFRCASEVILMLGANLDSDRPYDASNPLGIE